MELHEPPDNIACNDCSAILGLIVKDNQEMFGRKANGITLREFDELTENKPCQYDKVCLPRVRLTLLQKADFNRQKLCSKLA